MKKHVILFCAAVSACFGFMGCENDFESAKPLTYDDFPTATITGRVLVVDDYTDNYSRNEKPAPATIEVMVEIPNGYFVNYHYGSIQGTYRAKASYNPSTGEYRAVVPVTSRGVEVSVTFAPMAHFCSN